MQFFRRNSKVLVVSVALIAALAMVLTTFSGMFVASANERQQKEQEAARIEREREILASELEGTEQELAQAYIDLQAIEQRLPAAEQALTEATAAYEQAQRDAELLAQRLQQAETSYKQISEEVAENSEVGDALRDQLVDQARRIYRGDQHVSTAMLIFNAEDSQELVDSYALRQTVDRIQGKSLSELELKQAALDNSVQRQELVAEQVTTLKQEADAHEVETAEKKQAAADLKAEVEDLIEKQAQYTEQIEAQREAQLKREEELAGQYDEVRAQIAEIARKEQEAEKERQRRAREEAARNPGGSGGGGSSPSPTPPSSNGSVLGYPTAVPYITSHYGMRMHPIFGYERLHAGTDFRAYCGTPILAAQSGTVSSRHYDSGSGNTVILNHGIIGGNSIMTAYFHFSSFAVSAGQQVSKGQVIGYSGNTGSSTACHLHFEAYVNGATVNPVTLLP